MKIASAAVLAIVLLLFGFWWGWVRAPGPEAVCEHIIAVTKTEAEDRSLEMQSEAVLIQQMKERCMKHKADKLLLRGRLEWATYARCIVGADDLATIGKC
ncbi:MAG: hypothetical protein AAF721_31640 [Myxococcota bacterium]